MKLALAATLVAVAFGSLIYLVRNPLTVKQIQEVVVSNRSEPPVKPEELLLPDLVMLPPRDLLIARAGNFRKLRFTSIFANTGRGAFEAIGHTDRSRGLTFASQYVKKIDGSGYYKEIGQFLYHPAHRHWHIEGYVKYELLDLKNGKPGQVVASSDKQSVCLWDERLNDPQLPDTPKNRVYPAECNSQIQGISIGWSDIYNARIEGQELDITTLTDGSYLLRYVVNPDQRFLESDYTNNSNQVTLSITDNRVTVQ